MSEELIGIIDFPFGIFTGIMIQGFLGDKSLFVKFAAAVCAGVGITIIHEIIRSL